MSYADVFSPRHSDLNPVLFGEVGTERNGGTLCVVSVFARQGEDPWHEAGLLAAVSSAEAIEKLALTIARMPNSNWTLTDATKIATRLVSLLPTRHRDGAPTRGDQARRRTNHLILIIFFLLALALAVGRIIGF
jgi:hypothetical protein